MAEGKTTTIEDHSFQVNLIDYDLNGNIQRLVRNGIIQSGPNAGDVGLADLLTYNYLPNSNKLNELIETGPADVGFEPMNTNSSMSYDNRGNITSYGPQGVDIDYNFLDLPKKIANTKSIIYDAEGNKWKQDGSDQYAYINGLVYKNGDVWKLHHEDGAYNFISEEVEYQIKDHLGSVRVYFSDEDGNGAIAQSEVLQRTPYYPFGMVIEEHPEYYSGPDKQNHKYNDKEEYDFANLEWLDFGARWYDPGLGRFSGIDPIADEFPHVTTYNYAENDPVTNIDLYGLQRVKHGILTRLNSAERMGGDLVQTYKDLKHAELGRPATADELMATGKLMKYIGDGAEGGGLLAAPITGGASTTLILAGKLFSIGGSALEYIGKYQKNGISNELIIDASIDGGINLAPIPLIRSIKKSSYDDLTKEILENEVEKITLSTDFGIDYIEAQDKKENSQEQIDCFQDDCE